MKNWRRTLGQVLLAVGAILALGGLASFVFPNVELRALGSEVTSVRGRLTWVIGYGAMAIVGFRIMRLSRTGRPA